MPHGSQLIVAASANLVTRWRRPQDFTCARGQAVIVMDDDLQDPPGLIPEFFTRWREGFEVVYGIRTKTERDASGKS